MHLIIEAEDRVAITRGLKGLQVRFARNLNKLWGRKGRVSADRYHDHVLRTPREVHNAIAYVLNNSRKHGQTLADCPDPYSSGQWFPAWADRSATPTPDVSPISPPGTWLGTHGWRIHGPITPFSTVA